MLMVPLQVAAFVAIVRLIGQTNNFLRHELLVRSRMDVALDKGRVKSIESHQPVSSTFGVSSPSQGSTSCLQATT
jgi:hypothetical protein